MAWAHPKFGNLLASCSYDRRVVIWYGFLWISLSDPQIRCLAVVLRPMEIADRIYVSRDRRKEESQNNWIKVHEDASSQGSGQIL